MKWGWWRRGPRDNSVAAVLENYSMVSVRVEYFNQGMIPPGPRIQRATNRPTAHTGADEVTGEWISAWGSLTTPLGQASH